MGVGIALLALVLGSAACSSPPSPLPPPADDGIVSAFDSHRAWRDARKIASYGAREPGSRAAAKARSHVRKQLEKTGVVVEELSLDSPRGAGAKSFVTLLGTLEGTSSDVFLLLTSLGAGETDDPRMARSVASGPALLLELARVLGDAPRPYAIWLAFIDGDIEGDGEGNIEGHTWTATPAASAPAAEAGGAEVDRFAGSRALAAHLAAKGDLDRIRIAVWIDTPGHPDLVVARDPRSHRTYREVFWQSADELGLGEVFDHTIGFERAETGHLSFVDSGMRRVVAIAPRRSFAYEAVGPLGVDDELRARDHTAAVGAVTLESFRRIAERLERIDEFAVSPLSVRPAGSGDVGTQAAEP